MAVMGERPAGRISVDAVIGSGVASMFPTQEGRGVASVGGVEGWGMAIR